MEVIDPVDVIKLVVKFAYGTLMFTVVCSFLGPLLLAFMAGTWVLKYVVEKLFELWEVLDV